MIPKSVLYLSPYFWPEEIGSAPYSTELAQHLRARGYNIDVLAFRPHYPNPDGFEPWQDGSRDQETHEGMSIERIAVRPRGSGGFKDRILNDLGFLRRAITSAYRGKHRETDVIIAYIPSVLTLFSARILKLRSGAPIVAIVHDIESGLAASLGIASRPMILRLMRLTERIGLNFASEVVVLTEGMKTEIEAIGCTRPIHVLPIWSQVANDVPIDAAQSTRVMYSGNFGKKQNLDQLLPLLEHLSKNMPDTQIIMRGGGSERPRIEAEVKSRGIANAQFLDLAPASEFMTSLQNVNVHLVPQALNVANYALPSKLISIMSAGRPFVCIAEPESPLDKLAQASQAGICVYPGSETRLCEEVEALLCDSARQQEMGDAGRAFVANDMNRGSIFAQYEETLRRVSRS